MTRYEPPHEVRDPEKLQAMIAVLESGESLPPVLVLGEIAFSGSHRLAAWSALEMEPEVIELTDEQYDAIIDAAGFGDSITDYEDFRLWANDLFDLNAK